MQSDKIVRMANQIATFFASQPGGDAAERVAGHLKDFWSPQMRRDLFSIVDGGGDGLSPLALDGARHLAAGDAPPPATKAPRSL
ncbi:formate dehydrogenase subunit delta [Pseudoroseicyclus sp. CXY001]|uniref:formate dehydrogenase subunit delta n=1 Tax=Pseudoroseicyclus sp. CXY001 TaxID=3242492 RepID=UPI00358DA3BB